MKKWTSTVLAILLVLSLMLTVAQPVSAAASMTVSDAFITVLKKMEGFRSIPYWDYTQWTVGYGTCCPQDKLAEYQTYGISVEAAEQLLRNEVSKIERAVNSFSDKHGLELAQHQFDALVSFSYNCGTGWMSETDGFFYNAVVSGATGSEFIYAIGLYSGAGGSYVLMPRRLCEANMYLNGEYKAYNSGDDAYPSTYKWVFLDGNGGDVRYGIYAFDAADNKAPEVLFTRIPTGVDSEGNSFVYELAGWYTESGRYVPVLDESLENDEVLYARWKDPSGEIVSVSRGQKVNIKITVTGTNVNVRSGPGTQYSKVATANQGDTFTITEIYEEGDYTWGKYARGWLRLDSTNYDSVKPDSSNTTFPKSGVVVGSGVNYRSEPTLDSSAVVGQKSKGDRVIITEECYSEGLLWGKMSDGNWICLDYVTYDKEKQPEVTGISMLQLPNKTAYLQGTEVLKVAGGIVQVHFDDGSVSAMSLTNAMVSGFSNENVGTVTVNVTYSGQTTSFPVTIIGQTGTVTFQNYDGTVLSTKTYNYGETIEQPEPPARQPENGVTYEFVGWDKEVTTCAGDAVYTAVFRAIGDINADGQITNEDVVYLLWYTMFPEQYPVNVSSDFTGDGLVTNEDVVYLLWHTMFPEQYPL